MKNSGTVRFPSSGGADTGPGKPGRSSDPLDEFAFEGAPERVWPAAPEAAARDDVRADASSRRPWLVIGLAILALAQAPFVVLWALQFGSAGSTGNLVVDTEPSGVEIRIDGKVVGVTPLRIPIGSGQRTIELRHGDVLRSIPLLVTGGETVRQRVEFIPTVSPVAGGATTGSLEVTTDPSRVTVLVDGSVRGVSPLSIADLATGEHALAVRFATGTVERTVQVQPGSKASVQISMPSPSGALSGWVDINAPVTLRISEGGRLLGTTDVDRLMLPVGDRTLEVSNDELGFRAQRTVRINPGATTSVQFELPRAPLSINARPWAEVWIDGERVGETPLGNLTRPIGRYEVVLRHPELGERRESVLVTLKEPARVSVDLRPQK